MSVRRILIWLAAAVALTAVLWLVRHQLDKAHLALAFLLLVLIGSARAGRTVGVALSIVCFLAFNYFLLPPYYTLRVAAPIDWGVLLAFLVTAAVGAQLLHRQQVALRLAEERAIEVDRLAAERVRLSEEAGHAEALREADRLKDALLASVSHDLRTPLTTIQATAQELRLEGEERGALIEEEAERLNRLVADLLDLSRLTADAMPMTPEINAAEDLVGVALQRLQALPGAADIRVRLPADGSIALGRFDFVQTLRALTNLMQNALTHSRAAEPVEIEVDSRADDLLIRVLDRGSGIPERDRERLFEPFFRSASSAGAQGTGLGLAIASRIARAQGGSVSHDARPGGGSIFTLILPAARFESIPPA